MIKISKWAGIFAVSGLVAVAGCSKEAGDEHAADHHDHDGHSHSHSHKTASASPELKPLVLETGAPAQAIGVAQARDAAPEGEEVVVEGRLKDFIAGKAAFTMVDGAIKSCLEMSDDGCETPWDYCCIAPNTLAQNTAAVQLVGADGKILDGNLKGVNSIDHLSTVVVTGKTSKDEAGNLVIAADKVYLK